MKHGSLLIYINLLLLSALSLSVADGTHDGPSDPASQALTREASSARRKAMDYRVLSLNALKNADAEREEAHKALVAAMTSGKSENMRKAREELDNAADDLKDVIEQVEKAIEYSMKAEMAARKAEEMCKPRDGEEPADNSLDVDAIKGLLSSSSKQLAKAEEISKKLRRDWLEPFFASTTTTSSTTSTTKATPAPKSK